MTGSLSGLSKLFSPRNPVKLATQVYSMEIQQLPNSLGKPKLVDKGLCIPGSRIVVNTNFFYLFIFLSLQQKKNNEKILHKNLQTILTRIAPENHKKNNITCNEIAFFFFLFK